MLMAVMKEAQIKLGTGALKKRVDDWDTKWQCALITVGTTMLVKKTKGQLNLCNFW